MNDKIAEYYKNIYIYKDMCSDEIGYYTVGMYDICSYNIREVRVATQFPDGRIEYYFNGKSYTEEEMLKVLKLDIYS